MIPLPPRLRRLVRPSWARLQRALYAGGLRSTRSLTLPDFLGIGAQKAGTTWLHANLRLHPELYLPDTKEVHYFDWQYDNPLAWYAAHFEPGRGRVAGEITPGYSILTPDRIRFIHRLMPDLRLVFLMRHPVDRAWSQALMNLVTRTGRRFDDVPEAEFIDHFRSPRSVRRGNYLATIRTWTDVFPEDRLYLNVFEAVEREPQRLLREVFAHLGVSTEVDWSRFRLREVVHGGPAIPMPDALRTFLQEFYRDDLERLHRRFGPLVEAWRR